MAKLKNIELSDISRYRSELMGMAMIFVVLFHVYLPRESAFFGLRRMGNIGVDMFLFLSGIGLWYSWTKTPSARHFYIRRFMRIYPTWLLIAGAYYIYDFTTSRSLSTSIVDLIGDIGVNWDFWLHDELTFWYVPAIMMLYLFAVPYMMLIERHPTYRWLPVLMIMWCVIVQYVVPIHQAVGHIEIFWSRVPIFFIGINMGAMVKGRRSVEASSLWLVVLTFVISLAACVYLEQVRHGRFPLYVERMLYIPLTITLIILLGRLLHHLPSLTNKAIAWIGTISLEVYLLHAHFVLNHVETLHLGYWLTFVITMAVTLPVAYVVHYSLTKLVNIIEKKIL